MTKLPAYREIPSVRHIVFVSQYSVSVEHHFRDARGKWKTEQLDDPGASLVLKAVGATLPLAGIYDGSAALSGVKH